MASRFSLVQGALPVFAALAILLLVWQFGAALLDIPTYILPRPAEIVATAITKSGLLGDALYVTLVEAVAATASASAAGPLTDLPDVASPTVDLLVERHALRTDRLFSS